MDVKGGDAYNRYDYTKGTEPYTADEKLHSPLNDRNDKYPSISHVVLYLKEVTTPTPPPPPVPKGSIEITKLWDDGRGNSNPPEGTRIQDLFKLYNGNNEVQATSAVADGKLIISDITPGTYDLTEVNSYGYLPSAKIFSGQDYVDSAVALGERGYKVSVTVTSNTVVEVIVTNTKEYHPQGSVTITKHWDDGQVNSALGEIHPQVNLGELFMLLGNGAPVDVQKAAAGDKLTLSGIAPGAYELAEVGVEGYTPVFKIFNRVSESLEEVTGQKAEDGSWKIPVTVADAQELKVDVTNIKNSSSPPPQPKGSIEVEKLWNNGNGSSSVPEGANIAELFVLLKNNQPVQVQNSVSEGILKFDDIEPGEDYELAELKFQNYSPEFKIEEGDSWNPMIDTAYEDKGWKVPVKVEADQTVKVRVTNCKPAIPVEEPKGGITITKQWVDFNNKTITAPEEDLSKLFTLRKCEEASTLSAASIIQGTISESSRTLNFSNLSYGTYVLTESKIDGYTPDFIVAGTHQEAQYDAQKGWWITIDVNKKDAVSVEVINKKAEPKAGIEARVTWLDSKDNVITDPGINLLDILTVKDSKGNIVSGASLVNGAVRWESLPLGTYTFEEKQLDGYETSITMNENTVKVSKVTVGLSADKQLAEISVVNKAKDKAVEVVADTGNNLPRTDRTFEEEYIMMILGILAFGVGAVLKLRKQHVK